MNRLSTFDRIRVLNCLVEGMSLRSTARITGVARNTIGSLLTDVGLVCSSYQDRVLRGLNVQRVQCDEIWSFVYAKQKSVPEPLQGQFGFGDVWTWVAIDADTKLALTWMVGPRDAETAELFMHNVANRISNRVQLTTDGLKAYLHAVDAAFGGEIDYAMIQKIYAGNPTHSNPEVRYSPGKCIGEKIVKVAGTPNGKHISTSYIERQNLTMRMHMRRFTRLTNAFSKKIEQHCAAISLHFMYVNFIRIHQTLGVTPAMAAGVTDRVWEISDIVDLLQAKEPKTKSVWSRKGETDSN